MTHDPFTALATEVETLQSQYVAATDFAERIGLLQEKQWKIKKMDQLVNEHLAVLLRKTAE